MTHVTCRLTAKSRDQLRNPTLGNQVSASFFTAPALSRSRSTFMDLLKVHNTTTTTTPHYFSRGDTRLHVGVLRLVHGRRLALVGYQCARCFKSLLSSQTSMSARRHFETSTDRSWVDVRRTAVVVTAGATTTC